MLSYIFLIQMSSVLSYLLMCFSSILALKWLNFNCQVLISSTRRLNIKFVVLYIYIYIYLYASIFTWIHDDIKFPEFSLVGHTRTSLTNLQSNNGPLSMREFVGFTNSSLCMCSSSHKIPILSNYDFYPKKHILTHFSYGISTQCRVVNHPSPRLETVVYREL